MRVLNWRWKGANGRLGFEFEMLGWGILSGILEFEGLARERALAVWFRRLIYKNVL